MEERNKKLFVKPSNIEFDPRAKMKGKGGSATRHHIRRTVIEQVGWLFAILEPRTLLHDSVGIAVDVLGSLLLLSLSLTLSPSLTGKGNHLWSIYQARKRGLKDDLETRVGRREGQEKKPAPVFKNVLDRFKSQ